MTSIHTSRLTIRLVEEADLADLLEANGDDAVTRYLPYPSWQGLADAKKWFDRMAAMAAAREAMQFVLVERNTLKVIGSALLFRFDAPSERAEIGYVLSRERWGTGYMLEALTALVGFAFKQMKLRRLEAVIDPRNAPSAKVLERLGFVAEGLQRERSVLKGEMTDSRLYGLLRSEWREPAADVQEQPAPRS